MATIEKTKHSEKSVETLIVAAKLALERLHVLEDVEEATKNDIIAIDKLERAIARIEID